MKNSSYIKYTWFLVAMVFLVILAGGVVRMTQSGMGCPDWPKCFGKWIPPVSADQLPPDFEKYLGKQDIDHSFNVYHTWIEYINRLLGALLGVFILIHFVWSYIKFKKNDRAIVLVSLLMVLGVGFQGWLGKKVVDTNLAVVKITVHMLMALVLIWLPVMIINRLKKYQQLKHGKLKWILTGAIILILIQVILGTQVREEIDEISKSLAYAHRESWIGNLSNIYFIHRSFSWLIFAVCIYLFIQFRKHTEFSLNAKYILFFVLTSFLLGVIMDKLNIPAIAQPLHLMSGFALVTAVFMARLKIK